MEWIGIIVMWLSVFIIFWAMVGYPVSLILIRKLRRPKQHQNGDVKYEPDVTVMIVAHNEEKVIRKKLENMLTLEYPREKLKIIVTSDCSTDKTNPIVREFIEEHKELQVILHETVDHKGKTNAQNEAQRLVDSEILVMTDANAMFETSAVREIVKPFAQQDVYYVAGQLKYVNDIDNKTAASESAYWKMDLKCREIESDLQTITAGNGAIYACRNEHYKVIPLIGCHDSSMPLLYALDGKKALYCPEAIAYEKAGEEDEDEFKRKVRMNRVLLSSILPSIRILNVFKYKWFTYCFLGHRTCRYLLWIAHLLVLLANIAVVAMTGSFIYAAILIMQILFYLIAIGTGVFGWKGRIARIIYYYCMVVAAQWVGVKNILTGKAKPVWEKAESTR